MVTWKQVLVIGAAIAAVFILVSIMGSFCFDHC